MAQELYFFKFNKGLTSQNLKQTLLEDAEYSFLTYFQKEKENSENYDPIESQFEALIQKVETNIELITVDELELIFYWFYERNTDTYIVNNKTRTVFSNLIFKKDLRENGIDNFSDFPFSKKAIRSFYDIMGDYEFLTKKDIGNDCQVIEFRAFLNYLVYYSIELNVLLNKLDRDDNSYENRMLKEIITRIGVNNNAHNLALKKIALESKSIIQMINQIQEILIENNASDLSNCNGDVEEIADLCFKYDSLLNHTWLHNIILKLRDDLNCYSGQIKIIYSY